MGLRPPHNTRQRAAERLRVEQFGTSMTLEELRRGATCVILEGDVGPGAAEPLGYLEVALEAGEMQRCRSIDVGGVDSGARAVQPLGDVEATIVAGAVQRCHHAVSGVDRGACAVQPLGEIEVALGAGEVM